MPQTYYKITNERIEVLVREVLHGEHKKDTLINSSYALEEETQAMYFSNMRKNMCTDVAHIVMNDNQYLRELDILKRLKAHE